MPASSFRGFARSCAVGAALVAALLSVSGCSQNAPTSESAGQSSQAGSASVSATPTNSQGEPVYTPAYKPNGAEVAIIKTNKGTIKVKLYGADAPINTANFIELAQKGFYDDLKFHRLEPGFVIQGGDPQTKGLSQSQVKKIIAEQKQGISSPGDPILGTGGPGYVIKGEFSPGNVPHPHVDGTLAMARSNDPDSAGSQFYFTLGPQSFLDGNYTVFGDTTDGLDVIHKLEVGDVIESVTIENATK